VFSESTVNGEVPVALEVDEVELLEELVVPPLELYV
jgi:hypothetical protein